MGTLFSSLDIALSGMQASQVQLEVSGHNIANVNTEGFTRQRVMLAARTPADRSYGYLGRGVEVQEIERVREAFLDKVYRQQTPGLGQAEVRASYFNRMENIFQEPSENGFSTNLSTFFDTLNDFANNVEELPVRISVVTEAQTLAASLQEVSEQVYALRTNANEEVANIVSEINSLASRIAEVNQRIRKAEASGDSANDLRDDRDLLLDELSSFVNVTYRERDDGQVDVVVSGDMLVDGSNYRELEAVTTNTIDPDRPDLFQVQFAESGIAFRVEDGQLYGALDIRDTQLVELQDRIDTIAASIIEQVNRIHSVGNGLDNLSGATSSTNAVADSTAALVGGDLPFDVTAGSFDLVVYESSGAATTTTINITAATSLDDLATQLNAVANFSASVTGGVLTVEADSGYTYTFADDSAGALTALGVNGFFTGTDASSIEVNAALLDNPRLLSSGYSLDITETGDNTAALAMAELRDNTFLDSGTSTINDYYETTIAQLGVEADANDDMLAVEQAFVNDFEARRLEVSGVSLDEEVTHLIQYQRAYEASARIVSVADRMLDALIALGQ